MVAEVDAAYEALVGVAASHGARYVDMFVKEDGSYACLWLHYGDEEMKRFELLDGKWRQTHGD